MKKKARQHHQYLSVSIYSSNKNLPSMERTESMPAATNANENSKSRA